MTEGGGSDLKMSLGDAHQFMWLLPPAKMHTFLSFPSPPDGNLLLLDSVCIKSYSTRGLRTVFHLLVSL